MKIVTVIFDADLGAEIRKTLESAEHEVIPCDSLAEARGAGMDLIFAEWAEGPRLAELLRDLHAEAGQKQAPVVVLAPAGRIAVMHRARAAGAADVLFRPLDPAEVRAELAEAMTGPRAFDPALLKTFEELRRDSLVGESLVFLSCLDELKQAARCDANVLLIGETGTGKEMFAQGIHRLSRRVGDPYMAVNCASLPSTLLESELFGHRRGAFTDAKENRAGRFEDVGAGTLLLDEIGDIGIPLQVKLLRAIEAREFTRVGENKPRHFNARLICATAADLETAVAKQKFRQDLLGRINQFRITIPPLRERRADVPLLAWHFLQKHAHGRRTQISPSAVQMLETYDFTMNVRQLENAVVEALARSDPGNMILPKHLPEKIANPAKSRPDEGSGAIRIPQGLPYVEAREEVCRELDRLYLIALLRKHHNVQRRAAKEAGIDPKTFAARLADVLKAERNPPDA